MGQTCDYSTIHNMSYFEKRKKIKHFLYTKTAVIVLCIIAAFLIFSVYSVFQKRKEAYLNVKTVEHEVMVLRENEAKTRVKIEKLSTPEGVEEAIRNRYRAAKEGEGLVVITEDTRGSVVAPLIPVREKKSLWQQLSAFFSKE